MAFTPETFSPLGANSSEGISVYKYETEDSLLDVSVSGYFSQKDQQLKQNDIILVVAQSSDTAFFRMGVDTSTAIPDISGGSGTVDSVFGRTGAVIAQSGDYDTGEVTEASNLYYTEARVNANALVSGAEQAANKNALNGYAGLSSGKLDISVIPTSVIGGIKVVGFWNANTNTPDLSALTLGQGEAYQVDTNGSTNLNGETNWRVKDLAVWDDGLAGNWFKIDNTDDVLSVHGRTGAVVSSNGDYDTDQVTEASNLYYTDVRVSSNSDVSANTASRHDALTLNADTKTQDALALSGQELQIKLDVYDKANETGIEQITGPIITPPTLTATADNYNPTGFSTANMIRQDINANNREISGFLAPSAGVNRIIRINNLSTSGFDLRFLNNNSGSVAANRILVRDSANKSIKPNETAAFWYDHTSLRWRPYNRTG